MLGRLGTARSSAAPTLRSLQFIVPTPAGSQPDLLARWLIEPMARSAGVPGLVLNQPGASGAVAVDAVLHAAPGNAALLLGGLDHVAYSHVGSGRRAVDPLVDFIPVASVTRDSWVVVIAPDAPPARSLKGLAQASRISPLAYASNGEGTTAHLLSRRLCTTLGIDGQHVPYRTPWIPDLLAGRIQFAVTPLPGVLSQLQAGRLIALATLTRERLPITGQPPSIAELGWPDQAFHGGLFLFAPSALEALAPMLNRWFLDAVALPDTARRYREAAIEVTPFDLEQTAAAVRQRLQTVDAMRVAVFGLAR